tara:strand:- start:203 stop:451 length:249 start_codon:yes stop_codon:yes gene_type:complete
MTDTELREALVDLAAFILWTMENVPDETPDGIFTTVSHDVNGLIRRLHPRDIEEYRNQQFFVPRSAGYGKEFQPGAKEAPPF